MENRRRCKLEEVFKRFKGQPVEILTDDGIRYCGIDLACDADSVEIIDKYSRVILIPYAHVSAVVEPTMQLTRFCGDNDCECRNCGDWGDEA